jgi:hypothetical protein
MGYSTNAGFERTRGVGWKLPTIVIYYTPYEFIFFFSFPCHETPQRLIFRKAQRRSTTASPSPTVAAGLLTGVRWKTARCPVSHLLPHFAAFFAPCCARSPSVCNPRPRSGFRRRWWPGSRPPASCGHPGRRQMHAAAAQGVGGPSAAASAATCSGTPRAGQRHFLFDGRPLNN